MAPVVQAKHRAGALKQTNKSHKTGRHRSKGSISGAMHGMLQIKKSLLFIVIATI